MIGYVIWGSFAAPELIEERARPGVFCVISSRPYRLVRHRMYLGNKEKAHSGSVVNLPEVGALANCDA